MKKNPVLEAIKLSGSTMSEIARRLGVTKGAVYQWKVAGEIPAVHCKALEEISAGNLSPKDMRNDWEAYWPELKD